MPESIARSTCSRANSGAAQTSHSEICFVDGRNGGSAADRARRQRRHREQPLEPSTPHGGGRRPAGGVVFVRRAHAQRRHRAASQSRRFGWSGNRISAAICSSPVPAPTPRGSRSSKRVRCIPTAAARSCRLRIPRTSLPNAASSTSSRSRSRRPTVWRRSSLPNSCARRSVNTTAISAIARSKSRFCASAATPTPTPSAC